MAREIFIRDTHRALWYEDGVLVKVVGAGRYRIPGPSPLPFVRRPRVEVELVDVRERELTIKGQEILTADKVAVRVSVLVQFRVVDPAAAMHQVENYFDRLYSDVQLAARRSLATMTLEEILTDRNRLSADILGDVSKVAGTYGVSIGRAEVKDLVFPGNLQEIMNKVLAAERTSQAQLVEARTKADAQRIAAEAQAAVRKIESEAQAEATRRAAEAEVEATSLKVEAEARSLERRAAGAAILQQHPALMRLGELETLRVLGENANARIYVGFDKYARVEADGERG